MHCPPCCHGAVLPWSSIVVCCRVLPATSILSHHHIIILPLIIPYHCDILYVVNILYPKLMLLKNRTYEHTHISWHYMHMMHPEGAGPCKHQARQQGSKILSITIQMAESTDCVGCYGNRLGGQRLCTAPEFGCRNTHCRILRVKPVQRRGAQDCCYL